MFVVGGLIDIGLCVVLLFSIEIESNIDNEIIDSNGLKWALVSPTIE